MASHNVSQQEGLQAVNQYDQDAYFPKVPVTTQVQHEISPQPYSVPEEKILGLRRVIFFLVLALCLVIIASAIGGAVGGTRANPWYDFLSSYFGQIFLRISY